MVLLTLTPGMARALARVEQALPDRYAQLQRPSEPALAAARPGDAVSHRQLIALAQLLKQLPTGEPKGPSPPRDDSDHASQAPSSTVETPTTLNALLRSTTLYSPPPPPKPPQTPEYHALMARLRADEEARSYERMLHPAPARETFAQRFPGARAPVPSHFSIGVDEVDDVSYEEVHRQIILIINVLISIVCVAVFVWVAARHWAVGKRLGLALGSSLAVAVAEVVVYSGYVRKVHEAKAAEKKKPEIKEIVASWVLDRAEGAGSATTSNDRTDDGVRFRKGKHR